MMSADQRKRECSERAVFLWCSSFSRKPGESKWKKASGERPPWSDVGDPLPAHPQRSEGATFQPGPARQLSTSSSFILPASCLLNLQGLSHPVIHTKSIEWWWGGGGVRIINTVTQARGLCAVNRAELVSHSPSLTPVMFQHETHFRATAASWGLVGAAGAAARAPQ